MTDWDEKRAAMVPRLKRAEGQIRGVQRMIESGEDCEQLALQMTAVRRALDKAFFEMMACAVAREIERHQPLTGDLEAGVTEVTRILAKYG
ncbi:MAG: hypothetical protein CMP06_10905 [Xanthomonadales bacterium]|nr:hypothetical protein [Xanthomonadales bacterium]